MKSKFESIETGLIDLWGIIAYDVLALYEDEVPRDEMIEFLLDASRLETMVDCDPKELALFRAMTYEAQVAVATKFFPFDFYGY